jgi:intracellular sulfur oxidation DsrE/DsrF family protein
MDKPHGQRRALVTQAMAAAAVALCAGSTQAATPGAELIRKQAEGWAYLRS